MAVDVFCDEAGRGGGNLFDDQPWFVLAAHDYSDTEALDILPPLGQAAEWKWSAVHRRARNFGIIADTLSNPALTRSRISVFIAEKPYVAWLKLYEDLYGDALNTPVSTRRSHADRLWSVLGDHWAMQDVLNAYAAAARNEDHGAIAVVNAALQRLSQAPSKGQPGPANRSALRRRDRDHAALVPVLDTMRSHVLLLDLGYESSNMERGANLDPHIAALGVTFDKWAPPGTLLWVHKQTGPPWVRVHHHHLHALSPRHVEFIRLLPGIESFAFLDSASSPAIQLADMLAGAVAMAASPQAPERAGAVALWRWLREEAIDARFIWELIAHPRHHDRYPLVRTR